jgi:NAD(P)-dependent dehydrogenase (short-subunit alcohol dehydrogenase family)
MRLKDSIALVTGATQGIGRAVAERLGSEGATVVAIASRDVERAAAVAARIRDDGGLADAEVGDVTDRASVRSLAERVLGRHGRVDVLVNCAGVFLPTPAGERTDDSVDRTIATNLTGTFNMIDAVVPSMKARRVGRIINVASVAGLMGIGGYAVYCATKAGIVMMTRALACELAPHGIRINAVAPGNTATPMNESIRTDAAYSSMLQAMAARTPSGRTYSTPEEMAAMVAFLASEEARSMHGTTVLMDEGFSAGM